MCAFTQLLKSLDESTESATFEYREAHGHNENSSERIIFTVGGSDDTGTDTDDNRDCQTADDSDGDLLATSSTSVARLWRTPRATDIYGSERSVGSSYDAADELEPFMEPIETSDGNIDDDNLDRQTGDDAKRMVLTIGATRICRSSRVTDIHGLRDSEIEPEEPTEPIAEPSQVRKVFLFFIVGFFFFFSVQFNHLFRI